VREGYFSVLVFIEEGYEFRVVVWVRLLPQLLTQLLAGKLARVVCVDHLKGALQVLVR
jgi:hypothetical protein